MFPSEQLLKAPFLTLYKWKFNTQRVHIKCLKAKGCLKSGVEMEAETVWETWHCLRKAFLIKQQISQLPKIHRKRAWHNGMGSCHVYFFISINETTLSSEYLLMTKLSAMTVKMVKASFSTVSAKKKELISFRCSRIALTLNSRIFPHTLLRQSITVQRNSLLGKNKQTKKKRKIQQ